MPAVPGQEILDTVDGRDRDMEGVRRCLWGQRHLFKQRPGKLFPILRDLQERHFGQYTQAISRGDRIPHCAFADHESRDIYGKTVAIPGPPFVRGLLVGRDP